jgi:hypothetical protein
MRRCGRRGGTQTPRSGGSAPAAIRDERVRTTLEDENARVDLGWRIENGSRKPARHGARVPGSPEDAVARARPRSCPLDGDPHWTIKSARTSGTNGSSRRCRRIAFVPSNGRFASTRNGSRGRRTVAASASTTSTFAQRPRRCAAQYGSSSIASTRRAPLASCSERPRPEGVLTTRAARRTRTACASLGHEPSPSSSSAVDDSHGQAG